MGWASGRGERRLILDGVNFEWNSECPLEPQINFIFLLSLLKLIEFVKKGKQNEEIGLKFGSHMNYIFKFKSA